MKVLIAQNQSLPNIVGQIIPALCGATWGGLGVHNTGGSGSFYAFNYSEQVSTVEQKTAVGKGYGYLGFDASRSNSAYGRGDGLTKPMNVSIKQYLRIA